MPLLLFKFYLTNKHQVGHIDMCLNNGYKKNGAMEIRKYW